MKKISYLMLAFSMGMPVTMSAQNEILLNGQESSFPQKSVPHNLLNYQNDCYFLSNNGILNTKGGKLLTGKNIGDFSVNPAGTTFAVIANVGKDKVVKVYDLWKSGRKVGKAKLTNPAVSSTYSSDGTRLYVCDNTGTINIFRASDFKQVGSAQADMVSHKMTVSNDGRFLALTDGNAITILNASTNNIQKHISVGNEITAFDFSENSQELAVLTANGMLTVFDTNDFSQKHQVAALGAARDLDYHPQGKYVSVVTGDSRIALINLVDKDERMYVNADGTGVTDVFFCKDARGGIYMVYNTEDAVHYKLMNELPAYLSKMLDDEVKLRMEEWEKRMPEESLDEYRMRVNDETRQMQMRLFEEEIATRMAMDMGGAKLMALESYNPETNMMALDMGNMPDIYIQVPREEVIYFMNTDDVEIRNAIYGVGKNDKLEMVYADVYNKKTGKTYTFNNRERQSLEYLTSDDRFIPLEYVQQSAMDEMKLDEIKQTAITAAMKNKSISEHTKINVSTKTISEVDGAGKKHVNYQVSFDYTVDASFSEREDFAPGKYQAEQSAAAQTMLSIINQAMQKDFASYTGAGKKVKVTITGSADAIPIKRTIAYRGEYGDFVDAPVVENGAPTTITVTKASGISANDQLAFLRASGMEKNISTNVSALKNMQTEYEKHVVQAEGVGGQYRRISVNFTFYDAF